MHQEKCCGTFLEGSCYIQVSQIKEDVIWSKFVSGL